MKKLLSLIILTFMFIAGSYCQQKAIEFKDIKVLGDKNIAYFNINESLDDYGIEKVSSYVMKDERIISFRIYNKCKCQATIKPNVDAIILREILNKIHVDFDFNTVIINDKKLKEIDFNN